MNLMIERTDEHQVITVRVAGSDVDGEDMP
ncbi:hypothetical protein FB473_003048 [Brooklawnia cerclae]|uniref:Uncharacterized protein n=1 Tax=Brooklawnia cerclae TaxID=349934 RepID=A0ABX0SIZ0_9ACTN|nr:hypothetical protein [Brooklawnia cerclae]